MIKLTGLALVVAAAFAVTSLHAGDKKGCCARGASNHGKKECSQTYTKLNLSPDQKTKLDAFQAQCDKAGCTKESMAKFMKSAEGVLSKEQFVTLKAECNKHVEKTQS
jgi:hypothetical protein